jgi:hypothetical protein
LTTDNETGGNAQSRQEEVHDDGEHPPISSPRASSPGLTSQPSQAAARDSSPSSQHLSVEHVDGVDTAQQQLEQLEIVSSDSDTDPESSDLYQDSDDDQDHSVASDGPQASPTVPRLAAAHGSDMPVASTSGGSGSRQDASSSGPSDASQSELAESIQDFVLPRWQSDAEVTYCPICKSQFSIFVRKHHCRYVEGLLLAAPTCMSN